ncbi:MAG: NAD(P)H-binding protein [Caldimonas sp.]
MARAKTTAKRRALLAGATGLIGRALLPLLRQSHAQPIEVLARRAVAELAGPAVHVQIVDFAHLPESLPGVDDAFIALGTTIKVAGSQAAFRAVDLDAVVAVAAAARRSGATRLAVVSALGADRASGVFYNRIKGEMEEAVAGLGFGSVVLARPSLLVGDRAALGQPVRAGEVWASRLVAPFGALVPAAIRPIAAAAVAAAMVAAIAEARPGVRVLSSAEMQRTAGR